MQSKSIGLALSGGGVRAAVFHIGVIRHLAKIGKLEDVSQISTVSGGSLIVGAIFSHSRMRWPTSEKFLEEVEPKLRSLLTSQDLFSMTALGWQGIIRENTNLLFHRSEILERLLVSQWGITGSLAALPDYPEWHINTTSLETGKSWRFSKKMMGDWIFGRQFKPDVPIATAIAASAAVPYAFGALRLKLPEHGWWSTDPETKEPIRKITPPSLVVRLWDGGVYENMGLEALYKPSSGLVGCDYLVCSDASGPLSSPKAMSIFDLLRGKLSSPRLFDIAGDQIRSLRSRMLMNSINQGHVKGALLRMGTSMREYKVAHDEIDMCLTDEQGDRLLNYPTNLTIMAENDFDDMSRHGAEVCKAGLISIVGG